MAPSALAPLTCRPYKVLRHVVGRPASEDVVVHEETDDSFYVGIYKSRSEEVLFISCGEWGGVGDGEQHEERRGSKVLCVVTRSNFMLCVFEGVL